MRQVGAKLTFRFCSLDRVTVDARSRKESVATGAQLRIINRRLPLCPHPLSNIVRRVCDDTEQHTRILQPAIFSAVTDISAWFCRLDPHYVAAIRNEIDS